MRRLRLALALLSSLALSPLIAKEDAAQGEILWEFPADGRVMATAALDTQRVYFGTASHSASDPTSTLYCLDRTEGTEVWSQTFPDWLQAAPAITNTRLLIGCDDSKLYCLDKATGDIHWQVDTFGRVDSTPCVDTPGNCYFGSRDRFFYAVDPTGTILWTQFLTQGIASSPLLDEREDRLYVADLSNTIYAFTLAGERVWQYKPRIPNIDGVRLRIYSSPTIDDEHFLYIGSGDHHIYAIDRATGQLFWKLDTGGVVDSSPVISADEFLYVANREGLLIKYLIEPFAANREIWQNDTIGQVFYGSPTIDAENNIYICGSPIITNPEESEPQTKLSYIDRITGETLWSIDFPGYTDATPVIDAAGSVYLGTASGTFTKVHGAGKGLADAPWPTFHGQPFGAGRYEQTFRQWLISFNIPPELAPLNGDFDEDGFHNFEEFVLGSDPSNANIYPQRAPLGFVRPDSDATITFDLQKGLQAPYHLEMSTNLQDWLALPLAPKDLHFENRQSRWRVQAKINEPTVGHTRYFRIFWDHP